MASKQQRTFLTNGQKLQLKQLWGEHPDLQLLEVVDWVRERFGVSVGRATLYRIYHTPAEAFAGNAQQKKGRRVKFPALESDILAFYKENQRLGNCNDATLSDDALLRAAAELRARHGIPETELKLSNGWLHRFKERHALRVVPQATGGHTVVDRAQAATGAAVEATQVSTDKPKRKPRAPPRRKNVSQSSVQVLEAKLGADSIDGPDDTVAVGITDSASSFQQPLVSGVDASNALEGATEVATVSALTAVIEPLTYLSAVAVGSVAAVGFVRWNLHSGMAQENYFSVGDDGVSILRDACYQINVELQHTTPPPGASSVIFKVWAGVELLGQCECSARSQGGRALSVLQLQCMFSAQTVIRVEYHAPGVVYSGSRLVLRLLSEFA
ncbi:hypothetical protein PHYPSEUDO_007285 [Phytophthora pseudosyringae]|uniref:HTH CENPB-type domain-containing protein n=1 Tax=Phytophthora pseudosyringae TaxID=221518 RepID=A0A8T1VJL0_9STRA|nr:hypothetical protein PHYPSEUDO_007285 [Phytophthora pseudosyringae]